MARVLPNVRDVRTVLVRRGVAWSHDDLAKAAKRRRNELRFEFMPRVTESTYRENAGRESLTVRPAEGTFDGVFSILEAHPRTFIEFDTDEFVGVNSDGESKVPGPQTILKTLKVESVARGFVIGEQTVFAADGETRRNDVFRVTLRGLADEMLKLPKWYVDLAGGGSTAADEEE